nr:phosphoethanolamine transferase [Allomuricauda sp.]
MKSTWGYITLIVYTLIFILAFRISPKRIRVKNRLVHIGAVVIIFGLIVFSLRNSIPKYRFLPQSVKISYAFVNELRDYKRASDENKLQVVDAVLDKPPNQKHTFVLILGETCSRNHMSLYGADINTNPKLSKRKDIIKFTDVISGYNYTIQSVPAMLSQTNLENKLGIAESIDILDTFHSAGFKTFWISNQSPIGIWDNVISGIARKSDHTEFVNTSSNSSQEAILSRAYDENLFKPFKSALEEDENSKFIVLHLMGSHNTYSKRYPPSFEHFKGKSSRKEEVIAEYRNSIRYNDFVVDSLLTILDFYTLSEGNEVSSAIYVSDHGENVFDEMDGLGHDYAKELPRAVVEIPFLVWLSPGYREKNTGKVNSILENKDKPYVTDDLFHSMIDISNIKTPLLDSTKSVFNQHFDHKRRRVLVDGKDYDRESETVLKERKLGKKKAL